jgi:predicted RNA binding protein YcfA (HicA-like mRNA interferase family)
MIGMPAIETNAKKIIARLEREGWVNVGGKKHTKFSHPNRREPIMVPRHTTITPRVARSIAKAAGWL